MNPRDLSVGAIKPGEHQDLITLPDVLQRLGKPLLENQPSIGRPFGPLFGGMSGIRQRRLHTSDGD
jgi:hypothetical protein